MVHLRRVFIYAFHQGRGQRAISNRRNGSSWTVLSRGDLKITPVNLPHGSITTTGFLFEQEGKDWHI